MAVEGVIVYNYQTIEDISSRFNAVLDQDIINNLLEIKKNNKFIRRKSPLRLRYKISTASTWRNERDGQNLSENERIVNNLVSGLNKISDKNYEVILGDLTELYNKGIENDEILQIIANTVCEKAMVEKIYSNLYAKLISDLSKINDSKLLEYTQKICDDFFKNNIDINVNIDPEANDYDEICKILKDKTEFTGGFIFIANLFIYDIIDYSLVKQYYNSLINYTNAAHKDQIGRYIDAIISIIENCGEYLQKHDSDNFKENFMSIVYELISNKKRVIPKHRFRLMDIVELYENGWKNIENEGWQQV